MKDPAITYSVGIYASLQSCVQKVVPHTVDECTSIFQLIAAGLGIVLVLWRIKVDMFRKKRKRWENKP
jgi:hypothetical protein